MAIARQAPRGVYRIEPIRAFGFGKGASDEERVAEVVSKIRDSSELKAQLREFQTLLSEKGFDFSSGKPPSIMQMVKLISHDDVKDKIKGLKDTLEKEGIELTPSDLTAFMSLPNADKK